VPGGLTPPTIAPIPGSVRCDPWVLVLWPQPPGTPNPRDAQIQIQPSQQRGRMWRRVCYMRAGYTAPPVVYEGARRRPEDDPASLPADQIAGRLLELLATGDEDATAALLGAWIAFGRSNEDAQALVDVYRSNGLDALAEWVIESWNAAIGQQ